MDNLTHSLVGVLMARAGLDRYAPAYPTLLFVVAANSPDLDILVGFTPELYLSYHRHLTHSVFAVPLMAAVSVCLAWAAAWLWTKARGREFVRDRFGPAWLAATAVGATHPLLDWMNSYGLRPWLPFSDAWYYGDLLFVIDLVVWAVLLAGVWWSTKRARRRTAALAALGVLCGYIALSGVVQKQALASLRALRFDGAEPEQVAAFPGPMGPLDWAGYAEAGDGRWWFPLRVGRLAELRVESGVRFGPASEASAVDAAWRTRLGRAYRGFARFPVEQVDEQADGDRTVTLSDLRFYRLGRLGFACYVRLDGGRRPAETRFEF